MQFQKYKTVLTIHNCFLTNTFLEIFYKNLVLGTCKGAEVTKEKHSISNLNKMLFIEAKRMDLYKVGLQYWLNELKSV